MILAVLVAGMLSATLLDFAPGAWIAFGALMVLGLGRLLGVIPGVDIGD